MQKEEKEEGKGIKKKSVSLSFEYFWNQ